MRAAIAYPAPHPRGPTQKQRDAGRATSCCRVVAVVPAGRPGSRPGDQGSDRDSEALAEVGGAEGTGREDSDAARPSIWIGAGRFKLPLGWAGSKGKRWHSGRPRAARGSGGPGTALRLQAGLGARPVRELPATARATPVTRIRLRFKLARLTRTSSCHRAMAAAMRRGRLPRTCRTLHWASL